MTSSRWSIHNPFEGATTGVFLVARKEWMRHDLGVLTLGDGVDEDGATHVQDCFGSVRVAAVYYGMR